ncbi:MAG: hypothetical protein JSS35_18535, partial [Proteobacteria bacterium]|nr:hypothetical protein [Pseudomonadota bacterium]
MATYFFAQMTQADADAFNPATDTVVFDVPANQATVIFNPLTLTSAPSVSLSLEGKTLTFANDGAQVRGTGAAHFLFSDASHLYIGTTGADGPITGTAGADGLFGGDGDDQL